MELVDLALKRETLQATRPEGCWCLGVGGKGYRYEYGQDFFETFCGHCPEGLAEWERYNRAQEEYLRQRESERVKRVWDGASIPKKFRSMTLDTRPETTEGNVANVIEMLRYKPMPGREATDGEIESWKTWHDDWQRSWLLKGGFGVGKTGLAVGYARERLVSGELGGGLLFRTVPDLLDELKWTYDKNSAETTEEVMGRLYRVECLILDDLGSEQVTRTGEASEWVKEQMFKIVNKRHDEEKCTVFTTNKSLDELKIRLDERILWRIVEMCKGHIIEVQGPNLRQV